MRIIKHKEHTIQFYDTPETMPMRRYQRFNKFLMIENEVGSDFADFNKRSVKAIDFLKQGLQKEAVQELSNRRQMVYNAFAEYSPKGRALAILVHSINGEEFKDFSKDGLDLILDKLDEIGFTQKQSTETVDEVKKKIEKELAAYFPSEFKGVETKEYNNELLKKLRLEVDQIINGHSEDRDSTINRHEKNMLMMDIPNNWNINSKGNMEVEMEVEFEKFILSVSEHANEDLNDITVFRFYSLVQYIKEKNPKGNKNGNN